MIVKNLSKRERKLWNKIRVNSGVVMAYGVPGIAKSATFRSIADKLDMQYIDMRTSTKDETDFGVYPIIKKENGVDVVTSAVPEWAIKANEKPTLIHFEELNLASAPVRSAVLGILLERIVADKYKLNSNVYMVASGNPADEYNEDAEEFGTALRNRLIPIQFKVTLDEWMDEFARENVNNIVTGFLQEKASYFGNSRNLQTKYMDEENNMSQYPSPRSWTMLSDYISSFDGAEMIEVASDPEDMSTYVGEIAANAFASYVRELVKVNIKNVLDGTAKINEIDNITATRLVNEFSENYNYFDLKAKQIDNFMELMEHVNDEIVTKMIKEIGSEFDVDKKSHLNKMKKFKYHSTRMEEIFDTIVVSTDDKHSK